MNKWKKIAVILLLLFGVYINWGNMRVQAAVCSDNGVLMVTFLAVGQGDCILLQSQGQTMLIDAGKTEYGNNVLQYLQEQGITKLDYVLITHDDADHIGGFNTVLRNISVGKLYHTATRYNGETNCQNANQLIQSMNIPVCIPITGSTMQFGSATIQFLAPNGSGYASYNDNSIVIRVVNGENSFLLTGDAEVQSEKEMLAKGYTLKSDVLKVGHHSALTSSSQEFIDAVNPSISVITCDENGAAGFPRLATIDKLTATNIYRTDISGTITFTSDGTNITSDGEPYFYANSDFDLASGTITRTLEDESSVLQNIYVGSNQEGVTLSNLSEDETYNVTFTKALTLHFSAECGVAKLDSIQYALVDSDTEVDIDEMEWDDTDNGKVTLNKDFEGIVYVKFENELGNIVIKKTNGFLLDCSAPTNCKVQCNFSNLRLVSKDAVNTYERYTTDDYYPTFQFSSSYGISGKGSIEYMYVNRNEAFDENDQWMEGDKVTVYDDFIGRIYVRFTDGAGNQIIKKTQGFKWINGGPINLKVTSNLANLQLFGTTKAAKTLTANQKVKISFSADFGHGGKKAIKYQLVRKGKKAGAWVSKSSLTLQKGFEGYINVKFVDKAGNTVLRKTNYIKIKK